MKERSRARTRVTRTQQVFVFHVHPSPVERNRLIERPIGVKTLHSVADEVAGEGEFQKSSPPNRMSHNGLRGRGEEVKEKNEK